MQQASTIPTAIQRGQAFSLVSPQRAQTPESTPQEMRIPGIMLVTKETRYDISKSANESIQGPFRLKRLFRTQEAIHSPNPTCSKMPAKAAKKNTSRNVSPPKPSWNTADTGRSCAKPSITSPRNEVPTMPTVIHPYVHPIRTPRILAPTSESASGKGMTYGAAIRSSVTTTLTTCTPRERTSTTTPPFPNAGIKTSTFPMSRRRQSPRQ